MGAVTTVICYMHIAYNNMSVAGNWDSHMLYAYSI